MTAINTSANIMPDIQKKTDKFLKKNHFLDESTNHKSHEFSRLREQIAVLDGGHSRSRMPLGVESLDSALAGGLARGRVHMVRATSAIAQGALTGFAICLLRRLMASADTSHIGADGKARPQQQQTEKPIVWCPATPMGGSGMLYGAGLAALGLDPGRLLIVDAPNPARRMAVLEDILRTEGLTAVVAEYDGTQHSSEYWMRLARRAQLAAEASGTTGFLLGGAATASGFETSWNISPYTAPHRAATDRASVRSWWPRWDVALTQARGGRPWRCVLEWNPRQNRLYESMSDQLQDYRQDHRQDHLHEAGQLDLRPLDYMSGRVIAKPLRSASVAAPAMSDRPSLTG